MKKLASFLFAFLMSSILVNAQFNINQVTPGTLSGLLTTNEMSNLTSLKITGNIDARDFKTIRDSMSMIETLDLSQVTIVSYTGTQGTLGTANTFYPENTIPRNAFYLAMEKSKLSTVIQPSNLMAIGRSAYNQCSGLSNINWPSGLTSIGYSAFYNCRSLKTAVIPPGVTVIDTSTFRNCISLTSVTIPSAVKEIRYAAFLQCSELTTLNFMPGSQLSYIGTYAFGVCPNLTSFTLQPTVNFIGNVAFLGTGVELNIPANHPYFTTINGVLYDKALTRLMYCPVLKTGRIDIPQTVTSIAVDAFYNCMGLDSISIPPSLQVIEDWAFENCTGLKTLTIPASVNQIWGYAFYNCSGLKALYVNSVAPIDLIQSDSVFNYINKSTCTLYVLAGLKAQYQSADKWKEFANIVEFSDAVTVTPGSLNSVFPKEQRASMKRLNLTGSIDARDFKTMRDSMPMLEYIDLSGVSIVSYNGPGGSLSPNWTNYPTNAIPDKAFYNKTGNYTLKTFVFPKNLTTVGLGAFYRCFNMISAALPPSVTTLGTYVFYDCINLRDFSLPPLVTKIPACAFINCGFSSVTIPNGVKILGDYAFQSCNNLEQVFLPASLDSIGYCTFTFNGAMKSFEVNTANPVFSSLDGVLFDKTRKTLVSYPNRKSSYYIVPNGVEVIDTAAFEGCYSLYNLDLPSSLTRLCLEAFYECNNLQSLEIPASVNKIESLVFYNCKNLKIINARPVVPADVTTSISLFDGVDRTKCLLRVPSGSKTAYEAANRWGDFTSIAEDLIKQVTISAGGLYNSMTSAELNTVTNLKITGSMDARDFKTIRESMPLIAEVDLSSVSIVAYNGWEGPLNEYHQYAANTIPPYAFDFLDQNIAKQWLTRVSFPTSVSSIGYNAFTNTGLKTLTLHEGITRVEDWAFYNCKMSTIALPASLTEVRDNAFGSNHGLSAFTVASGNPNFKTIDGVLYDKSGHTLINYPNSKSNEALIPVGTLTIKDFAFEGCDFISKIQIPNTVTNIVQPVFYWARNISQFDVAADNPVYTSVDGVLFDKTMTKLVAYPNQKGNYYDIPSGVSAIGPSAFGSCSDLWGVNIPMSVNTISDNAFYCCSGLTNLTIPKSVNNIESEAFTYCENLKSINVSWNYPVDLTNSANVFFNVDKNNCILRVPQGAAFNYRISNQWNEFSIIDEVQYITYRVKVPAGTKACYLAGEMNGWTQQVMNKEGNGIYTLSMFAHMSDQYKYCSGPDWIYEELDTAGNVKDNRTYSGMDTVRTWRNVYQPWMPYSPWKIESTASYSIGKIQFVSATEGWVASGHDNSLLHSTNGGETWNKVVPFPEDNAGNFSDPAVTMDWINPTHGWAMKSLLMDTSSLFISPNGAVIYNTADGGNTWARKAFPKSSETISYNKPDLQGTWQIHEIMEGVNSNPGDVNTAWIHTKVTVDANGNCTFSENEISTGILTPPTDMRMNLLSNGTISMENSDFNGFLNSDKNTGIFCTSTGDAGRMFGVMQRQIPGTVYSLADLQGTWQMHILSVDNPQTVSTGRSGWTHAIASIDASGNAELNMVNSHGDINSMSTLFTISPDGFISMAGMSWHGFMNFDKTAFYSTFTDDGGEAYDLCVMQKQKPGNLYSLSDLEGTWRIHEIALADQSLFSNGGKLSVMSLNIKKDGTGTVTNLDKSDEGNGDNSVQFSISSSGMVTMEPMILHGYMSADKNSIVYTMSDNQRYSLGVMQKDSTYSGDMGLQVQFADENNGWASTYNSLTSAFRFYRSTNGGTDWNLVSDNRPVGFFDFVDASNGWSITMPSDTALAPEWSIHHTTDGGLTWTKQYSEPANNDDKSFNALQFTDLNNGWITGGNGMLLKTVDGGQHWTAVTNSGHTTGIDNTRGTDSKALFFLDANTGWITVKHYDGNGLEILHTTDGGASWTSQNTNITDGELFSLNFWDENHGWFTGETYDEFSNNYTGIIGRLNFGAIEVGTIKSKNDISIYPNPVKDGFYIRSIELGSMVNIYNLNGVAVLKQRAEGDCYINVKDLKKGMYLVRITTSTGVINKKIVKM